MNLLDSNATHRIFVAAVAAALLLGGLACDTESDSPASVGAPDAAVDTADTSAEVASGPDRLDIVIDGQPVALDASRIKMQGLIMNDKLHAPLSAAAIVDGERAGDDRITVLVTTFGTEPGTYPLLKNEVMLGDGDKPGGYVKIFSTLDRVLPMHEPVDGELTLTTVDGELNDRDQFRPNHLVGKVVGTFRSGDRRDIPVEIDFEWSR